VKRRADWSLFLAREGRVVDSYMPSVLHYLRATVRMRMPRDRRPLPQAMKLRHAAALALMGWLLMVPPVVPPTREVNKSAPLKEWTVIFEFPNNEGCDSARYKLRKQTLAGQAAQAKGKTPTIDPDAFCALCSAQCVASDDPRLKR
jgi:hypothetical protein